MILILYNIKIFYVIRPKNVLMFKRPFLGFSFPNFVEAANSSSHVAVAHWPYECMSAAIAAALVRMYVLVSLSFSGLT